MLPPHHEWDSTIKAFRSFKANLREVYVIGLAVAEPDAEKMAFFLPVPGPRVYQFR
jgi:hypothetical protein